MFSSTLIALALSASAMANVFITSPTAAMSFTAGQDATITWQDDGKSPSLKDFGPAKISIYAGNSIQQTSLKTLSESTDVSTTSSLTFKPDASIGPNSNEYFIRIESLALKDAAAPQFPALAFSAKYQMSGMTGAFSKEVSDQIAGQSTAPLQGATAAPSGSGSPSGSASPTKSNSGSATPSGSKASTSAKPTESEGAAVSSLRASAGMVMAGAGAVAALALF
jgi:hypothetical protein